MLIFWRVCFSRTASVTVPMAEISHWPWVMDLESNHKLIPCSWWYTRSLQSVAKNHVVIFALEWKNDKHFLCLYCTLNNLIGVLCVLSLILTITIQDRLYYSIIQLWKLKLYGLSNWTLKWFFVVQWLSRVWLFAAPWTAVHQASLTFTISQSLLTLMSQWCQMKMQMTLPDPKIPLVPISKPVCFKGPGLGQLWAQGLLSSMSADGQGYISTWLVAWPEAS